MRFITFFLSACLCSSLVAQENSAQYKKYSYTEFFKLIEQESDTVFELNDAVIQYDETTDERFRLRMDPSKDSVFDTPERIIVDKQIKLNNVHFSWSGYNSPDSLDTKGAIRNVLFKKDVTIYNVASLNIFNCIFDGSFESFNDKVCNLDQTKLRQLIEYTIIEIRSNQFNDFSFYKLCPPGSQPLLIYTRINKNTFITSDPEGAFALYLFENSDVTFSENEVDVAGHVFMRFSKLWSISVFKNRFVTHDFLFSITDKERRLNLKENTFSSYVHFVIDKLDAQDFIDWHAVKNHFIPNIAFYNYFSNDTKYSGLAIYDLDAMERAVVTRMYLDSVRYFNKDVFSDEIAFRGMLYEHYRSKYDTEIANEVFMEMKDMETRRLAVIYSQDPSFRTFFKWKVNQFLKVFSDYGTEPSKAIVMSVYVVLSFALIYLFFPNHWDSHGKNRIMHRFGFFLKYVDRKAGIHEVYMEDKKEELLVYEDFRNLLLEKGQRVPKFFLAAGLPLYKWALSGSKLFSWFLRRVDVLKGTWEETPKSKRWLKSTLVLGAFLIALTYDLFIKVLNAVMLSINTFTTLGFGEIPIKGLPRYLAIIQGFIGWFMLTIFSVSLISQLLN